MESAIGEMVPIFAIIFTFGIPGIIIFWYINARHRERMRLIEKGLSAEEIKKYFQNVYYRGKNPYSALKWGILLAFVGLESHTHFDVLEAGILGNADVEQ